MLYQLAVLVGLLALSTSFGHGHSLPTSNGESWNSLLGTDIFPGTLDSSITLTQNDLTSSQSAVLEKLEALLQDQQVLDKIYSNYLVSVGKESRSFKNVFARNLVKIAKQNLAHRAGQSSWTMAPNQFSDMSEQELSMYSSHGMASSENSTDSELVDLPNLGQNPPAAFSWVDEGGVTPVKNQNSCGSCWAFTAVAVLESSVLINTKSQKILSEQEVLDCSDGGCGGWYIERTFEYLKQSGTSLSTSVPYQNRKNSCRRGGTAAQINAYRWLQRQSEATLRNWSYYYGPYGVGFRMHSDLYQYSSGVYNGNCGSNSDGHFVTVVGWGNEGGQDFWLIKNSWGTGWGSAGYFKMPRGRDYCGIESRNGGLFITELR